MLAINIIGREIFFIFIVKKAHSNVRVLRDTKALLNYSVSAAV